MKTPPRGWSGSPAAGADAYDVVKGRCDLLHAAGDFSAATLECLGDDLGGTTTTDAAKPGAGSGFWYLVRATGASGRGTYNDPTAHAPRDAAILASGNDCP